MRRYRLLELELSEKQENYTVNIKSVVALEQRGVAKGVSWLSHVTKPLDGVVLYTEQVLPLSQAQSTVRDTSFNS